MVKKEMILDAAAVLFAEKGYYATTVVEIADRVGLGKSTVYGYFSSKDHIYQETLKEGLETYMESMRGRVKQPCSVRDVIIAIATAHFNFIKENTPLARLLGDEYINPATAAREWLHQLRERRISMFASLIEQGIELGEFRPVDSQLAAEVFLGVLGALCGPISNGSGDTELPNWERFRRGIDLFFQGLLED